MAITHQAVASALRRGGHAIAAKRGISTVRAGAAVRKHGVRVRVYYYGLVNSRQQTRRELDAYAATLRAAGYTVSTYRENSIFIDVEGA